MHVRDLAAAMEQRSEQFVDALRELVNVDSGTFTPEGVNVIAGRCEERFAALGGTAARLRHEPEDGDAKLGDLVVGRVDGDRPGPTFLLIGHTDTVFSAGAAVERPFTIEGGRAYGPGVCDMKSGLLAGFFAMELLRENGGLPGRVIYVCNPDEEIGSSFSKPVIQEASREADIAFVLEPARAGGELVSARKGVTDLRIEITGRSAHAGVEPERGASAVLEGAHKVVALHALNGRWPGATVNAGVLRGGSRPNVVAERCSVHVDIRAPDEESLDAVERAAVLIAESATVPDTTSVVRMAANHRPMERTDETMRLVGLAQEVAGDLGFEIGHVATGGASDANTTASEGVPTLDGLGPIGGDAHSPLEWLDLGSVVPRVALLAGLMARVAEDDVSATFSKRSASRGS